MTYTRVLEIMTENKSEWMFILINDGSVCGSLLTLMDLKVEQVCSAQRRCSNSAQHVGKVLWTHLAGELEDIIKFIPSRFLRF